MEVDMKRTIVLAMAIFFTAGTIAVFAAQGQGCSKCDEKSLPQIVADSFKDFKVRPQDKMKPVKEINVFQNMSDGIKKGAAEAKGGSLRTK